MRKLFVTLVSMGSFFPGMIWLLFELDWVENAVGGTRLVLMALAVSLVPAWWAGRAIARFADPLRDPGRYASLDVRQARQREAAGARFLTTVGLMVLAVCAASRLNHARAVRADSVEVAVVAREHREARPRSGEAWRLVVEVEGRREDVVVSAAEWARSAPGSRMAMRRLHGALGFSVLYSDLLQRRCSALTRHAAAGRVSLSSQNRERLIAPGVNGVNGSKPTGDPV